MLLGTVIGGLRSTHIVTVLVFVGTLDADWRGWSDAKPWGSLTDQLLELDSAHVNIGGPGTNPLADPSLSIKVLVCVKQEASFLVLFLVEEFVQTLFVQVVILVDELFEFGIIIVELVFHTMEIGCETRLDSADTNDAHAEVW